MPSATDFKKSFGLLSGSLLSPGVKVIVASVGHIEKQSKQSYDYPAELKVKIPKGMARRALLTQLNNHLGKEVICYSSYGSPYACTVHNLRVLNVDPETCTATATFLGKAERRRDIPNLAEQKAAEREEQGIVDPDEEEIREVLGDGVRIITSRFGTSKCATCGKPIDPGVRVVKPTTMEETAHARGGWSHAACAMDAAGAPRARAKKTENTEVGGRSRSKRRRVHS